MTYEFEQKEAAVKAEQDKKDALAKEEKQRQTLIRNSFIGGFALVFILALVVLSSYRQKQKVNKLLEEKNNLIEEQKKVVEEKNKDITDSINYASRIQRALLTSDKFIGQHLPEFFILFKPKDIVSGDFYWANFIDGKFFLIAADCTGHGVPGAFMSLLNIAFLNEVTLEKKITRPDLILNEVRGQIIKVLNPEGKEEGKDGMDCILMSLQMTNGIWKMEHAAANNVPLLLRNGTITELHSDNMPVGIHSGEKRNFISTTTEFQKGDLVYAYTDGFADQFGGPKGKKFMSKQLKELLLVNSHLSMKEQKKILAQTFDDWKGNIEQVDDVLVIGMRI